MDDIEFGDVAFVYTAPADLARVREALRARGFKIDDAYLGMRATTMSQPQGGDLAQALAFLETLEEHEDVQRVFSNLDVSEQAMEALV